MKIIIFFSTSLQGRLMKHWTGCNANHAAFYDDEHGVIYEMDARRRKRKINNLDVIRGVNQGDIKTFPLPKSIDHLNFKIYLEEQTDFDVTRYGFIDYALKVISYYLRKISINTRFKNRQGMFCSEMVAQDLAFFNYSPWDLAYNPPSPCDILTHFEAQK